MQVGFLRKTGVPSSDQATLTTRFFRHGDILTVLAIIEDPIHLAEPQMMTKNFRLSSAPISPVGPACIAVFEGTELGESVAALPAGEEPVHRRDDQEIRRPARGGARLPETLYPEYRKEDQGRLRATAAMQDELRRAPSSLASLEPVARSPS